MTESLTLGRLSRLELREGWTGEATDFTPWLARDENIGLLQEAIGLELQVEATEQSVGPFRADILCKDDRGELVLIENQLEPTDHTHLGQILTYAAGLKAVTMVWIASAFTEQHRAALDWLNDVTDDRFNFFGLRIELWQIGRSDAAPRFVTVSAPNEWTRIVSEGRKRVELSDTARRRLDFWTAFRRVVENAGGPVRPAKPRDDTWTWFTIHGCPDFNLEAGIRDKQRYAYVALYCQGEDPDDDAERLQEQSSEISEALHDSLEWKKARKYWYISLYHRDIDPLDESVWPDLQAWMCERLNSMYQVFRPRLQALRSTAS